LTLRRTLRSPTRLALLSVVVFVISMASVEAIGAAVRRQLAATRQRDIAAYHEHTSLPRPVPDVSPTSQNASYWYQQALSAAKVSLSQEDIIALGREADDLERLGSRFKGRCVGTDLLLQATRSSYLDWGFTLRKPEPTDPAPIAPARFLAYCLVQAGAGRGDALDWERASSAYLGSLRFGADLRTTNLLGTLVGIDVARIGLAGLGKWVTTIDSPNSVFLSRIERGLAQLEGPVLSFGEAPRVERLEVFSLIAGEAEQGALDPRSGVRFLLPWRAITAYRLYQADRLLREAEATATTEDAQTRLRLAEDANRRAAQSWSPMLRAFGPSDWFRVRQNADELQDRYHVVQTAVQLEQWYIRNGEYPETISVLGLAFDASRLRYESHAGRQGYRLEPLSAGRSVRASARLVLERQPRRARQAASES